MEKKINQIIDSQEVSMGPIRLKQPLPVRGVSQVDPFLLLHHLGPKVQQPGGQPKLDIGNHPHRGFEPVSFIFSGEIHHKDSRGNDSVIGSGGVQWMTAGRGIVHSEGLSQAFVEKGGTFEMIQLWINLPRALKMEEPNYQGFQAASIPTFEDQDGRVSVNVVSGNYRELEGPVHSLTKIEAYTLQLKEGGTVRFNFSPEKSVLIYQLHGDVVINGSSVGDAQLVTFEPEGTDILIEAKGDSLLLFLAGDPIKEPVASWGPYVMNTQTEILQAMRDYEAGRF